MEKKTGPVVVPLLALKHISEFTPKEYKDYLVSLWRDPALLKKGKVRAAPKYLTGTVTKKGSLVIRCKRDPKVATRAEVDDLRASLELSHQALWAALTKRKIQVVDKIKKVKISAKA